MQKLLVKNGILIDKQNGLLKVKKDILISEGIIEKIEDEINCDCDIINASGKYVSAGMIDAHVHENKPPESFNDPDIIGVRRGATTIIEAGSVWIDGVDAFAEKTKRCKTKWFGIVSGHNEYNGNSNEIDIDNIHEEHYLEVFRKYPDIIKGIKCVCSNRRSNLLGYAAVKKSKQICEKAGLPLTVHIGAYPPDPNGFIEFLEKGDVITHTYHGKQISLFEEDGEPKVSAKMARQRGVLFDVGHGTDSYNYPMFDKIMRKGFYPDIISTDIRKSNADGPAYSLAAVMSKVLPYMSLEDIIHCNTYISAETYHLEGLGQLKEGYKGDLSIFTLQDGQYSLVDCNGNNQLLDKLIVPEKSIVSHGEHTFIIDCDLGYGKNI